MKRYQHDVIVPSSPEKLFAAITDLAHWPSWDEGLAVVEHDGEVGPGTRFFLRPRGGPRVAMTVEAADAPARFVDVSHLPLARMRTSHEFSATPAGTRVRVVIEVTGPLAFLWDRLVARAQAAGVEAQTHALAAYAEARS
jgi:uncharacterized protein YndB with AHSA1/START domain